MQTIFREEELPGLVDVEEILQDIALNHFIQCVQIIPTSVKLPHNVVYDTYSLIVVATRQAPTVTRREVGYK